MSDFVGEVDQFTREREERRLFAEGAAGESEVNQETINASLREMRQIAREAADYFSARGVFDGSDPRLSHAVTAAICSVVWLRYPEDRGNIVAMLRSEKGVTAALHWQTVSVEPLSRFSPDPFKLCLVQRNGAWKIFSPPYTAEFWQPFQDVGYQSFEFLGHERRWMRNGQLDQGEWDTSSAIMRLQWLGEDSGVYAEWKRKDMGAADGTQSGGCAPARIIEWLQIEMLPLQEEAILLGDHDLPLSFIKDVLLGLVGQSWDTQVLIPGPIAGVVYAIPVRFQLHHPEKIQSADANLGATTSADRADASDFADSMFGSSDFSASLGADGRVRITLAQDIDSNVFGSIVPYLLGFTRP